MYPPVAPLSRPRRRWTARRKLGVVLGAALVFAILVAGGWIGSRALHKAVTPSAAGVLAQLRQVPHPVGAVEVAHRTVHGSFNSKPSAWLMYQTRSTACPAALATFLAAGAVQQGKPAADPVASICKPQGKGYESLCLPTVCFFADFMSDHNPTEYTISTGPDGEG